MDFSGSCREEVKSCFVKAARRKGGTMRGARIEFRERRRRTVVVWRFTLFEAVGVGDAECGSGRRRDLELSSRSGCMERA